MIREYYPVQMIVFVLYDTGTHSLEFFHVIFPIFVFIGNFYLVFSENIFVDPGDTETSFVL